MALATDTFVVTGAAASAIMHKLRFSVKTEGKKRLVTDSVDSKRMKYTIDDSGRYVIKYGEDKVVEGSVSAYTYV